MSPVISGVTRQKFTKFLVDVAPYSLLLMHTIRFLALVQRMQVVSVGVDNIFATLFGCHGKDP